MGGKELQDRPAYIILGSERWGSEITYTVGKTSRETAERIVKLGKQIAAAETAKDFQKARLLKQRYDKIEKPEPYGTFKSDEIIGFDKIISEDDYYDITPIKRKLKQ